MDLVLKKGSTSLTLCRPDIKDPYYRGTRFDRSGIVTSLKYRGHSFVSQWFRKYDPYMHDAVCGPAEEFTQIGYDRHKPGKPFLKIGVGLPACRDEDYDRFKLYELLVPGTRSFRCSGDMAEFGQRLNVSGYGYDYIKRVSLPEDGLLRIEHSLSNLAAESIDCYVYNHNFFVLDGAFTGKDTRFTLPFRPQGNWRADYDCVELNGNCIVFSRNLDENESVFMGNLNAGATIKGWAFRLENLANGLTVDASSDADMEYAVFWANHEVACLEPYTPLHIAPGECFKWKIDYRFSLAEGR